MLCFSSSFLQETPKSLVKDIVIQNCISICFRFTFSLTSIISFLSPAVFFLLNQQTKLFQSDMATQQPALRRSSVWNNLGTLIVWKLCPGKTAKSWFFYDCLDFTSDWYLATAKTIFYSMGRYTITLNWGETTFNK